MSGTRDKSGAPRVRKPSRFHGRVEHAVARECDWEGCSEPGEFRAPRPGSDRRHCQWFCLEHVRAFNESYNFFAGLSPDEIERAQSVHPSWQRATRPFASNAAFDPSRMNYRDFTGFFADGQGGSGRMGDRPLSAEARRALGALDLEPGATPDAVRKRYKMLVRRFHPDMNGGDRRHEDQLRAVLDAYAVLTRTPEFANA